MVWTHSRYPQLIGASPLAIESLQRRYRTQITHSSLVLIIFVSCRQQFIPGANLVFIRKSLRSSLLASIPQPGPVTLVA